MEYDVRFIIFVSFHDDVLRRNNKTNLRDIAIRH